MPEIATPTQPTKPEVPEFKPLTDEEMAKYDEMLGFDDQPKKRWVRIDGDGKPDKKFKDFFYCIISGRPQWPKGVIDEGKKSFVFEVSKFSVKDTIKIERDDGNGRKRVIEKPREIARYAGDGRLVDPDAGFAIQARDFCKQFAEM